MKTPDELNALKEEVEALSKKLADLTDEELEQVSGGAGHSNDIGPDDPRRQELGLRAGGIHSIIGLSETTSVENKKKRHTRWLQFMECY